MGEGVKESENFADVICAWPLNTIDTCLIIRLPSTCIWLGLGPLVRDWVPRLGGVDDALLVAAAGDDDDGGVPGQAHDAGVVHARLQQGERLGRPVVDRKFPE